MSAKPHGQIDPEEAMQEHGDWLVDACMWFVTWFVTWSPVMPLIVYCAAVALTTIGIIVSHFSH
jgi:glucose uptake protein GlcU